MKSAFNTTQGLNGNVPVDMISAASTPAPPPPVNHAPVVLHHIADQDTTTSDVFSLTFPTNTFYDSDGNALHYSATLSNGGALPSWLKFHAATRTFSGTPPGAAEGAINVKVRATDSKGASVTDTFKITIAGGDDTVTGTMGNDQLAGVSGNDSLDGLGGNDVLNGGAGNDTMDGGDGSDRYYIDGSSQHTQAEIHDTGVSGVDEVRFRSTATGETLTLHAGDTGIERAVIGTGNGASAVTTGKTALSIDASGLDNAITLIGNAGANTLSGTAYNDTINGGAGNDALDGGGGADSMVGGAGSDTYVVDNAGDVVSETGAVLATGGKDTVQSSIDYTLGANIENLTLTGSAVNGTGNGLANLLTGNDNGNTLDGGLGNDTLNGGLGADTMTGGNGNDIYIVDDAGDQVTETNAVLATGGKDSVQSSIDYTLGDNLENLTLTGSGNINATGNSLANLISGNSGNNILEGGLGNDTLAGGNGNDTLSGADGMDVFLFNTLPNASSNIDIINDFNSVNDTIQLENSIFTKLTTTGKLAAGAFVSEANATAHDANDRILYDTQTGNLYYDADGSGAGAAVHFATLTGIPALTHADFVVV